MQPFGPGRIGRARGSRRTLCQETAPCSSHRSSTPAAGKRTINGPCTGVAAEAPSGTHGDLVQARDLFEVQGPGLAPVFELVAPDPDVLGEDVVLLVQIQVLSEHLEAQGLAVHGVPCARVMRLMSRERRREIRKIKA